MVSGPCDAASNCVTSPHFPHRYGNNDRCELRPVARVPLEVRAFSTEQGYDFLIVNGVSFSGSNPPRARSCPNSYGCYGSTVNLNGVMLHGMTPQGAIWWHSDSSATLTGWKICQASVAPRMPPWPPTPPLPPSPPPSPPLSQWFLSCLRYDPELVRLLQSNAPFNGDEPSPSPSPSPFPTLGGWTWDSTQRLVGSTASCRAFCGAKRARYLCGVCVPGIFVIVTLKYLCEVP